MVPFLSNRSSSLRVAVLGAGLLLAGSFAGGLPGAQDKAPAGTPLQHDVTVTLKLVQASVTGKDGSPVTDVEANEFEVTDNGQRVPITHFEKHFLPELAGVAAPSAAAPESREGRKFFLLFDFAFNEPRGYIRAKSAALRFMDTKLQPGDEVGLMSYAAGTGLVLHEYLTTKHQRVRGIVEAFGQKKVAGRAENLTDYIYTVEVEQQKLGSGGDLPYDTYDFYQQQARKQGLQRLDGAARQSYVDRARDMITAFSNLAVALRGLPGYKHILLFSSGIARQVLYGKLGGAVLEQWSTPEQLMQGLSDYDAAQADSGLRESFSKMVREFKAANSPIYVLDVSPAARDRDLSADGVNISGPAKEMAGTDSLRQFAGESGGHFFANTAENDRFADTVQQITGAYYVLGYSVNEKWDGKFHRIEVKVTRKGCKVNAQRGYYAPKPFNESTGFEKLVQMTDLALSDDPKFQVPASLALAALPVTVNGDASVVAFSRTSRAVLGAVIGKKAEAYVIVSDDSGQISTIKKFALGLPDPDPAREAYVPSFLVGAKPGRWTCAVVVRDLETGRAARGVAAFVSAPPGSGALRIDPPLLLLPDTATIDIVPKGSDPALSRLYGYDMNAYAPLCGEIPAGTAGLFAAVRCPAGADGGDLEFAAVIRDQAAASQAELPVKVIGHALDGTTRTAILELGSGELKPGRYSLVIQAIRKDGTTAVASVEFAVK